MKIVQLPKKTKGEYRTIYVPNNKEKLGYKAILPQIENTLRKMEENGNLDGGVIHGFRAGRSPVTNAWQHVGRQYTLSMDLSNFFDTVTKTHLKGILPEDIIDKAFVDGSPRQGLPSSPAVCNLAGIKMDSAILKFIKKKNLKVVYTRYADDLAFSFDDKSLRNLIIERVKSIAGKCGFKINTKKNRFQSSQFGYRQVTGVMVGQDGVYPSRKLKRKLRAAKHQQNEHQASGLEEWAKLKLPKPKPKVDETQLQIKNSLEKFGRAQYQNTFCVRGLREERQSNFLITNDLAYIVGMTDLATGWTSCYKKNGCNRNAPVLLSYLDISVGLFLDDRQVSYCGMKRNAIKARCIIYHARDGKSYAKSFYGNEPYRTQLQSHLMEKGIILGAYNSFEVVGYAKPYNCSALYDCMRKKKVKLKGKGGSFIKVYC